MTPSARTLEHLRKRGYFADKVEQRLTIPPKRLPDGKLQEFFVTRDVFGFGDLLALKPPPDGGILMVQVTSRDNVNNHITKLTDPEIFHRLAAWLAFARFEIHGWDKGGAAGKTKHWRYRRVVFTLAGKAPHWTDAPMLGEEGG